MKFLFVNTHFAPDYHYGGVVESGTSLYRYLRELGDFQLSAVSSVPDKVLAEAGTEAKCYRSLILHRFAFAPWALVGLFQDVSRADVVFVNGIFTWPATLAQFYALLLGKPYVAAVRGGLRPSALSQKYLRKWLYINLITMPLLKRADSVLVTSEEEKEEVQRFGLYKLLLLSNGVESPSAQELFLKKDSVRDWQGYFVFLYLGRTDREKGIDILIDAYRKFRLKHGADTAKLAIVGPDGRGYLSGLRLDYSAEGIERINGVYGVGKISLLASCGTLVLPSYTENFGNVVAEALACETPVITTTGTPWEEIEKVGCGLYVKPEADALYEAMKTMYLKTPEERREMGRRGRAYVLTNFNWEDKARELFEHLKSLASPEQA